MQVNGEKIRECENQNKSVESAQSEITLNSQREKKAVRLVILSKKVNKVDVVIKY